MHTEGDYLYRPFRNEWFAMAVVDCTAFYLSLANAALFFHQMTQHKGREHSDFEESSKYLSLCLNEVTKRLGTDSDNVSDGVITTVLGFLCHNVRPPCQVAYLDLRYRLLTVSVVNCRQMGSILCPHGWAGKHRPASWRLQASEPSRCQVCIMVSPGNKCNSTMRSNLTTCRFDVIGSSILDSNPRFPLFPGPANLTFQQPVLSRPLQALTMRLHDGSAALAATATALEQAAQLAAFVNGNAHDSAFWKDGATATRRIVPFSHHLLSLPRPDDLIASRTPSELLLTELARLALLIMVAQLKRAFSLISDELRGLQQRFSALLHVAPGMDGSFSELALWACVGVASMEHTESRKLHVDVISDLMRKSGSGTSKDTIESAKQLLWIDSLMDPGVADLDCEIDGVCGPSATF